MAKRYYWLKLHEDFFRQKDIKKLRQTAGGDTYVIIYLKMLLQSLKNNGRLYFDGVENDFVGDLALDIDEDESNVGMTVQYLLNRGILVQSTEDEFELTSAAAMMGSETDSAQRMREHRKAKTAQSDALPSQCDSDVTARDTEKEKRKKREEKEGEGERERGNAPTLPLLPTECTPYAPLSVQDFEKKREELLLSLSRK